MEMYQTALILGYGRSGRAAEKLLQAGENRLLPVSILKVLLFALFIGLVSCDHASSPSEQEIARLTDAIWANLYSAEGADLMEVESMLLRGADPNFRTENNDDYLLEWAAEKKGDKLILLLLEYGADPNLHEEDVSPLHWTCALSGKNALLVVQELVEHGANVDELDDVGSTPLHWAASGRFDRVAYLLEQGADVSIQKSDGKTPLDVARKYSDIYGVNPRYGITIYEFMLRHIE